MRWAFADDRPHPLRLSTGCFHQRSHVFVRMPVQQLARRAIRDDPPAAHDDDAIREQHGLEHVVRDHHGGQLHRIVQASIFGAQRAARDGIERAERLIHQHDGGLRGQRASDSDALLLTARQLRRQARQYITRKLQRDRRALRRAR